MPQPGSEPAADLVRRLWSDAQDLLSTGMINTATSSDLGRKQQDCGPAQPFRYASGNGRGEPALSLVTPMPAPPPHSRSALLPWQGRRHQDCNRLAPPFHNRP